MCVTCFIFTGYAHLLVSKSSPVSQQGRWGRAERPGGERKEKPVSPETGRRSRGRALSDERSKELARQDERQPDSRSPRPAAKPIHHRAAVKKDVLEKHMVLQVIQIKNMWHK